ncbi:MAG TPA: hypothetical protein VGQ06_09455 [Gemmatimonadales bacterium]|nr:hypothetical protein [Gemmatimonadales bacterium]
MLCTRCHEREAVRSPSPETRAKMEQRFGASWPFPDDICAKCLMTLLKDDPDMKAKFKTFRRTVNAKMLADAGLAVRSGVLKVLDWADRVAERWGSK